MLPLGLDSSGLSPRTLEISLDLATRLPFREAQHCLAVQHIDLSVSQVEGLTQTYSEVFETNYLAHFTDLANKPLTAASQGGIVVIQMDGCMVMETDKPREGQCEGREVKQAVIYREAQPSERYSFATAKGLETFDVCLHGLLRTITTQADELVGVADGSRWIDERFEMLGVTTRILDVFHACHYLDDIMLALDFDEAQRAVHRSSWLLGEVNARDWLQIHLPNPEVWLTWTKTAQAALHYLEKRIEQMAYQDFSRQGYPIGSGQIEGANKAVIAARMKCGGMRWSHDGINRMAALRSAQYSKASRLDFHNTRLEAFPT